MTADREMLHFESKWRYIMEKLEQLYEGKAKKVFKTADPDVLIVSYKDDATAFNGEKKGTIFTAFTAVSLSFSSFI